MAHKQTLFWVAVALSALGCTGDTTTGTNAHAKTPLYWALQPNYAALNMSLAAPYNTVQLSATAVDVHGTSLSDTGQVTYFAGDSSITVTQTGVVTARYRTLGTFVRVARQVDGVTLQDTIRVLVTDTIPQHPLANFSIHPAPGDSAKRSLDAAVSFNQIPWPATATDAIGQSLCSTQGCVLWIGYKSSNTAVADMDTAGNIIPYDTGHVVLTASTWAYGVVKRDSVTFRIGLPLTYRVNITLAILLGVLTLGFAAPKKIVLGAGAIVTFCNQSTKPVDVVFDQPATIDTASCIYAPLNRAAAPTGSGNIPAFGGIVLVDTVMTGGTTVIDSTGAPDPGNAACRRFPVPGVYRYHSSLFPSDTFEIDIRKE